VFVANFVGYVSAKNWINWMTSDEVMTNIKRVTFFLRHSVVASTEHVVCVCMEWSGSVG